MHVFVVCVRYEGPVFVCIPLISRNLRVLNILQIRLKLGKSRHEISIFFSGKPIQSCLEQHFQHVCKKYLRCPIIDSNSLHGIHHTHHALIKF